MRLVTFRATIADAARLGALHGDMVVDLAALAELAGVNLPDNMLDFIDQGPAAIACAAELLTEFSSQWPAGVAVPVCNVKLLAPIPRPRKNIFGIGLNYVEHVAESAKVLDTSADLPTQPIIFSKPPTAVIGPGDAIGHNAELTQQLDWEVELAMVIGSKATRVSEQDAMAHVFGYTVMIDVSARDCRRSGQWIVSKGQDTFAPMGPCIVTADEIGDAQNLNLWLTVNGVEKQNSNTRHLLFKLPVLISDISQSMSLEPGDIIATGTPAGVGAGRDPQEWMWPGDVVEAHVEKIGSIRHPIVKV